MDDPWANYQMLEELGSGSFGTVYKAIERATGDLVAIKHIDLDGTDDDILDIQQEIAVLSACSSPFVTQYRTSFVRGVKLWIVMEYLGGGSCLDLIKTAPLSEVHAAVILRELLLGLDYLHSTGKIHRDIKAANILLSHAGKVKIADFGVAAQLTNIKSQRMTFVGTPFWMAPEVIQEAGYDYKADIWSLGITAMELIQGEPPNSDIHPMKALFHIPKALPPRLEGPKYSRELKSFVAACLIKNAELRPSARDLLQHRFIKNAGRIEVIRDLISVRQNQKATEEKSHPKFYEETMRDMSRPKEEDDWVFDTIRPSTAQPTSMKKRKLSETPMPVFEPPLEQMMQLDINDDMVVDMSTQENRPSSSWSREGEQDEMYQTVQRRPSLAGTARRIPQAAPAAPTPPAPAQIPLPPSPSKHASPKRNSQISSTAANQASPFRRNSALPAQPSPSRRSGAPPAQSAAEARRLSALPQNAAPSPKRRMSGQKQPLAVDLSFGNSPSATRPFRRVSDDLSPTLEKARIPDENIPPATPASTKEAKLGRKAFSKIIDPSLQEMMAQTAAGPRSDALAKVSQAWTALDALDPEGEYLLFRMMLEKMQNEPKLASLLVPGAAAATPGGTPQKPKLVLAQNNPHLKSHRRRQSSQVSFVSAVGEKPNHPPPSRGGMEHTRQITEALYGKWAEGLKARCAGGVQQAAPPPTSNV